MFIFGPVQPLKFVIPLCNAMTGQNVNDGSIGFVAEAT